MFFTQPDNFGIQGINRCPPIGLHIQKHGNFIIFAPGRVTLRTKPAGSLNPSKSRPSALTTRANSSASRAIRSQIGLQASIWLPVKPVIAATQSFETLAINFRQMNTCTLKHLEKSSYFLVPIGRQAN